MIEESHDGKGSVKTWEILLLRCDKQKELLPIARTGSMVGKTCKTWKHSAYKAPVISDITIVGIQLQSFC